MHVKDRKRLEALARANGHWHHIEPFANALSQAEAQLADYQKIIARLRQDLADPPGDVQEAVLHKLGLFETCARLVEAERQLAALAWNTDTGQDLAKAIDDAQKFMAAKPKDCPWLMHPTQDEEDAASLKAARADGTAERAVDDLLSYLEGSQKRLPSLSKRMTEAGYPRRDTRLECEDCGKLFSAQFLPIHKCDKIEGT